MAKKKKNREIVVFESNTKKLYRLSNGILDEIASGDVSKNSYNVGCLSGNNVMFSLVEVPQNEDGDEISIITNKTYENLALDIEKDYKISYEMSNVSQGINSIYNVFVADNDIIETEFKDLARKVQYIDYIDMEPLSYQAYYSNNIINPTGIQVFIYMHQDYGTLCLYKDGELINYKLIEKLSTRMLHMAHCNNIAERIQENIFLSDLDKYGFDPENPDLKLSLNRVLFDTVRIVNNNLLFMLTNAQLDNVSIDKVIVGTDRGLSSNFLDKIKVMFSHFYNQNTDDAYEQLLINNFDINEYSLSVGEFIDIHTLDCNICTNIRKYSAEMTVKQKVLTTGEYEDVRVRYLKLNPFVVLGFLRAKEQLKSQNDTFNVSTFLRPPPFTKRYSGKLILATLSAFVLASIYPIYNYVYGNLIEMKTNRIIEEIPEKRSSYDKISNEIRTFESKLRVVQDELSELNTQLQSRYRLLNNIYDKKIDYQSKTQTVIDLTKIINKSNVKIAEINIQDNVIVLELKGTVKGIIEFLKNIGVDSKYYIDSKEFLIKNLSTIDENAEYSSTITIRVKR